MAFSSYGIQIGPLFIHYYGLIIMLGVLAAANLFCYTGRRRGIARETVWEALPWALIGGIIGARLWHVIIPSQSAGIDFFWYLRHPAEIFKIWNGGLGIPGAILGGAAAVYLFCRHYQISFPAVADSIAPTLPLAQAIGRWGNFVNQEIYGRPTDLPWAIVIRPENRLPQFQHISAYHPLFLYESLLNLLNLAILLYLDRKKAGRLREGSLILVYAFNYATIRFFLEFLRLDPSLIGALNANQIIMALIALSSMTWLILREKKGKF